MAQQVKLLPHPSASGSYKYMYAPVHFLAAVLLTQIIDNVPGKVVEDNPNA